MKTHSLHIHAVLVVALVLGSAMRGYGAAPKGGRVKPGPQGGQIVRDPDHPQWLMRKGGKHVFVCGPGDPEGFLYLGKRRPDGTRDGNQVELIRKLIGYGGNCIYMQTVRGYDKDGDGRKDGGGDGKADENPFVDGDYRKGANPKVLDQWEKWFALMDANGILIYLFIYDDGSAPWGSRKANIHPGERAYVETIVNRFKHHKNLIWIVGEEHDDKEYVNAVADIIAKADEFDHLIGNHHNPSVRFKAWQDGGSLNHHAMQYTKKTGQVHAAAVEARKLAEAAGPRGNGFMVIYSESTGSRGNDAADVRAYNWNIATAGVMPMRLDMKIDDTPSEVLAQCRILRQFFEGTDFYTMANHDELAHAGTRYVLADPGRSYIAYADKLSGDIGLKKMTAGTYDLTWVDCVTGKRVVQKNVSVRKGSATWRRPKGIGRQLAVWIRTDPGRKTKAVFPGKTWETRKPADVGLDGAKLDLLAGKIGGDGVVVRNGYLVKAWGNPARRGDWASAAKPVISTLLFFAVAEKKLAGVDAPIRPWVKKRWPGKDLIAKDRGMTFRHLADMTSGYGRAEAPGTHWAYNDTGISLYRHMMEAVFGTSLNRAALRRLGALQFEDGDLFGSRGGAGVNTSCRDFARIGWFWLNRGTWRGKRLLGGEYFEKYCRPDVPADLPRTKRKGSDYLQVGSIGGGGDQSKEGPGVYGFNWWFNGKGRPGGERFMPHLPSDAFQANGHWGKECMLIIPSLRIVVAARGKWGGTSLRNAAVLMDAVTDR